MMRKSMLLSLFVALLLILISYSWVYWRTQHKPARVAVNPSVAVIKVSTENYQPKLEAVGTLQANQGAILKAPTDGQVEQINFTPGQVVKAGDVLVTLNNAQQHGALDAAIAQEKLNRVMYQRDLELKKLGAISLAAVDQAKSAVDAGAAAVDEAQATYNLTIIKAPFSGRVGISKINLGDYLQSANDIVSLQNLDPMFIDFYIPEKYFSSIKTDATVKITANTLPDQIFTGKIVNYETVIDQNTGMLQVRAAVPNPQELLLPGGYATVTVYVGKPTVTINIPQTALMYDDESTYVYLIQDNKAVRQNVTLGEQIKQNIQILSGLKLGDIIVSAGTNKIHEGSIVQPVYEPTHKTGG